MKEKVNSRFLEKTYIWSWKKKRKWRRHRDERGIKIAHYQGSQRR